MLDLNFVRENLPLVEEKLRQRGMDPAAVLKDFREVDTQRRQAITEAETSKAQRNKASEKIAKLKKSGQDASAAMAQTKDLREKIQTLEKTAADLDARLRDILAGIPNLPHASVPIGHSAEQNVEVRRWGSPPKFDFTPKAHWDLGAELGILDLERAVKLTGARFAVYWDLGAKLERALMNFMLDLHTRQHGYTEVLPPYLVNSDSMYGTGQLPKFAADLFRVPHGDKDLWLIPTAESVCGSFPPGKSRLRIFIATKSWIRRGCQSRSPPTRRASAARRDRTEKMCAASSGSISFRKWNW